ncbi:MAG: hypothetical protein K2M34_04390 [Alphaproteobacteria bacterium]|nr:hypothetical protein [Alphaproteobacteria bacterium]
MAQYENEDEVVYDPSTAATREEYEQIIEHNKRAKILHAERREAERFAAPSIYTRFKNGIKNLFGLAKAKEAEHHQQPNQGKSR